MPSSSMLHRLSFLAALFLVALPQDTIAQTRTGSIAGTVRTADGLTLRGANLAVEGTELSATSSTDGVFVISNVPPGTHTLMAQLIGYAAASRELTVQADHVTRVRITLSIEAVELGTITVLGVRSYGSSTTSVEKGGANVLDVPQSAVVITEDFLEDQNATTLDDVLRNVSGITPFSDYQDYTARGFRQGEDEIAYNGMKANAYNFFTTPNLNNVESIEILKGPASVLYGDGEGGATINIIPKSPSQTTAQHVTLTAGSYDDYGASIDLTGPMSDQFLYRVLGNYSDKGSFRRFQKIQEWSLAPSVTWLASPSTSLTLRTEIFSDDRKGHRNRGIAAPDGDLDALPLEWTANEPTDRASNDGYVAELDVEHALNTVWRMNATARYAYSEYTNQYHEPRGFTMIDGRLMMNRQYRDQSFNWKNFAATAYVTGDVKTGNLSHRLLVNTDFTFKTRETSPNDYASPVSPLDVYDPVYGTVDPADYEGVDPPDNPFTRDNDNWGISAQDLVTIIPEVKVLVGGRYNHYKAYRENFNNPESVNEHTRTAHTYRGGVVVQPVPWTSIYGNFSEGFKPQSSNFEDRGGPFDPLITRQFEVGFKAELFDARLIATTSAYRITKHNVLVPDPDPMSDLIVTLGEVRSEGWELDLVGSIMPRWSVTANYANNLTKVTEDPREDRVGSRFPNAPRNSAAFWSRYDLESPGLGFALGASYVGERDTFDATVLPSYTVFDGAVSYDLRNYTFTLNVQNLFDKRHYTGGYNAYTIWPGTPRAVQLTVRAGF